VKPAGAGAAVDPGVCQAAGEQLGCGQDTMIAPGQTGQTRFRALRERSLSHTESERSHGRISPPQQLESRRHEQAVDYERAANPL